MRVAQNQPFYASQRLSKTASRDMSKQADSRKNLLLPHITRWEPSQGYIASLTDVHKAFGNKVVLDGINLNIEVGKTTVIIGQSGSGKSVLIKHLNALLHPDSGTVTLFGEDCAKLKTPQLYALRMRTGMILQDYALMDSMSVFENIAFPIEENSRMSRKQQRELVREILTPLDLVDAMDKFPSELSGGMKKRVSFARALIHQPELVLFDEPTTGLDPLMIVFVDELIKELRRKYALSSVIISHDIQSIFRLADRVAYLHEGKIIFEGTPNEALISPLEPLQRFFNAENLVERETPADSHKNAVIRVKDLHKSFGEKAVLKGIDLEIPEKKITVIIGGSGSGKSVLLKHVLGLFVADSGELWVEGLELSKTNEKERVMLRTRMGMLFQGAALFDSMTIAQNIAFPLRERVDSLSSKEAQKRVNEMLEQLKIEDIAHAFPSEISAGQRKRVGLARAIITKPKIMIYDEPTTGQDPIMIRYVDDMILEAHKTFGLTSIVISHDMTSTFRIADQIAMVYEGKIAQVGTPAKFLTSQNPEVQRFIRAGGIAS
ncbi:MAG: ATP-binding cassette domain-containing protein [Bradymonadales bacterium]